MTNRLSSQQLLALLRKLPQELTAREAWDLSHCLGPAAAWLLCDDALQRLANEDPLFDKWPRPFRPRSLPDAVGSCGIIYAVNNPDANPLVRPAFFLPLQWRETGEHDRCLPGKLRSLAERVCRHLKVIGWSLYLRPPFQGLDLNAFDSVLDHESGWAPLAGALLIRTRGGKPRPEVWATGRWDGDGGIEAVDGLTAKLELARHWGATDLFVPEKQAKLASDGLRIGKLKSGLLSPEDALRDFLTALDAPPPCTADESVRKEYFFRQPRDHVITRDYYRSNLLPDIIARCREQIRCKWPGWEPTHLITVVSHNPELIFVAAHALRVRHCLLLYTEDASGKERRMKELAEKMASELKTGEQGHVETLPVPFWDDATMPKRMWRHIEPFVRGVADDALVFDTTPGTKLMTLSMELLARHFRPAAWLLYVRHQMQQGRVVPFSEQLNRWQAKESAGPFTVLSEEEGVDFDSPKR